MTRVSSLVPNTHDGGDDEGSCDGISLSAGYCWFPVRKGVQAVGWRARGWSIEFAPVLLLHLHVEFRRGGFDAFPGGIAFGIGHPLHLLEARDCVADVSSVMNRLLTFLGESEIFIGDMLAAGFCDLGHASLSANRPPITCVFARTR